MCRDKHWLALTEAACLQGVAETVQWMRDNWAQEEEWTEDAAGSPMPQETPQDITHQQPEHASSNPSVDDPPARGNPAEWGLAGGVAGGAAPAEQWQRNSIAAHLQTSVVGQVMHTPV